MLQINSIMIFIIHKISLLLKITRILKEFYSNFWHNRYIEYESKGDRNKTISVEEYLN